LFVCFGRGATTIWEGGNHTPLLLTGLLAGPNWWSIEALGKRVARYHAPLSPRACRGSIRPLSWQKWSRGEVETRLANLPPCLIGMQACVGAHRLGRKRQLRRRYVLAFSRSSPRRRRERDFCRRRLARRKRLRDDISAQRPEIGDHHAREMAAKAAFVLAALNI